MERLCCISPGKRDEMNLYFKTVCREVVYIPFTGSLERKTAISLRPLSSLGIVTETISPVPLSKPSPFCTSNVTTPAYCDPARRKDRHHESYTFRRTVYARFSPPSWYYPVLNSRRPNYLTGSSNLQQWSLGGSS